MLAWVMQRIVWFVIRIVVTLACLWTIQNAVHTEGYYIDYKVLLVCAVCLIVGVRMWMPAPDKCECLCKKRE